MGGCLYNKEGDNLKLLDYIPNELRAVVLDLELSWTCQPVILL